MPNKSLRRAAGATKLYGWVVGLSELVVNGLDTLELFIGRKSERWRWWSAWGVCVCLLAWRATPRYLNEHIWAEDGSVFLERALNDGWASLLMTYAGYYHSVPQIFMLLLSRLNLLYLPKYVFWISSFFYAAAAATFTKSTYRPLVACDVVRMMTALGLCIAPGLSETFGNVTNIQWVLFLWGGLIACSAIDEEIRWFDVFVVAVIGSCTGGACTLLLPFCVRALVRAKRGLLRQDMATWACIFSLAFFTLANLASMNGSEPRAAVDLGSFYRYGVMTAMGRYILQPTIGERKTVLLLASVWYPLVAGALMAGVLAAPIWRKAKENIVLSTWVLSTIAFYLIAYLQRPMMHELLSNMSGMDRYAVPAGQCALIVWMTGIATYCGRPQLKRYTVLFALIFLLVYARAGRYRFSIPPFPDSIGTNWSDAATTLNEGIRTHQAKTVSCRPFWKINYIPR